MLGEDQINEKGSWGGCQRKTDFCLNVGKSFPWKGVGAALAVLRGSRDHAELTSGSSGVGLSRCPLAGPKPLHIFRVCRAGKPGPRFTCGFADCRRQYCAWHVVIVSCWILLFTSTLSLEMFKCLGFLKALFNSDIGSFQFCRGDEETDEQNRWGWLRASSPGRGPRLWVVQGSMRHTWSPQVLICSLSDSVLSWHMIWGWPWAFDHCQPPTESLPQAQIGSRAVGTFPSDDGLALGRPGAKGQKEKREAGKSNQRMFMLEGGLEPIGAQFPLFTDEGPEAQKREHRQRPHPWWAGEPGPKDKAFFQISNRSVSAHWLSCLANGQSKRFGGVLRWWGFTRQPPYTCRWNQSTTIGIFTMLPSKR